MLSAVVESFDRFVDDRFATWRGRPSADAAAYAASALGDHGLLWFLVGLARAGRPGPRRALAVRAVVFTGVVTPLVNAGLKAAVGRVRPDRAGDQAGPVRIPRTTSFPSGHALAAWCAASLLAEDDPWAPAYYGAATAISASRVHLRLHHASDVVAGALLGMALGRTGRGLVGVGGRIMRRLECAGPGGR